MDRIEQIKPTLWVFTDWSPLNDFSDVYWRECFHDEDFCQYTIKIIDGQYINHESFLLGDLNFKHAQMKTLLNLFEKNDIKDGDIFIFANAWNYIAVPLTFFKYEFDLDIKMIGFWGNSIFNKSSPLSKRLKLKKEFGYNFEMSLFKSYDLNCFLCDDHFEIFKKKHGYSLNYDSGKVTGFPFQYLSRNIQDHSKEDIIFIPYPIQDEVQSRIFKGIKGDHPEFSYVNSFLTHKDRNKFRELIKVSKFLFSSREFEHDPVLIYESMLNGVVPFIQNRYLYQIIFHDDYLIPKLDINKRNKYLFMMRHKILLSNFFDLKIRKYDYWAARAKQDAIEIGKKYYSNDKFLNELKQLTK